MIYEKSYTDSKVVRHLKYDSEERTIEVTYLNGRKFRYFDFPMELWEDAVQAISIGHFINKVKPHYRYEQIPS